MKRKRRLQRGFSLTLAAVLCLFSVNAPASLRCEAVFPTTRPHIAGTAQQALEAVHESAYKVLRYWEGPVRPHHLFYDKTLAAKSLTVLRGFYNGPGRFAVPFARLPRWNTALDRIFEKQYKDPNYDPTTAELALLKEYRAEDAFRLKRDFLQEKSQWKNYQVWMGRAFVFALALNGMLTANWALHLSAEDAFVTSDDFFARTENRLRDDQIRIYNETVPFPHMAIEIAGKVYSYGQTHLTVSTAREYLLSQDIATANRAQTPAGTPTYFEQSVKARRSRFGCALGANGDSQPLPRRSVRAPPLPRTLNGQGLSQSYFRHGLRHHGDESS